MNNSKALKILAISNGIFVFANTLLGPLFAIYAEKFDSNVISISFSWFIYMLSATIFTFLVGKFGDKIKEHEYLLIAGFLVRIVSWILYIFTNSFEMFIGIQVFLGIGDALGSPAFDALFARHTSTERQIKEYSNWKIVQSFSIAFASLIGGFIVYFLSFEVLFLLMAVLAGVSVIVILFQPRELL